MFWAEMPTGPGTDLTGYSNQGVWFSARLAENFHTALRSHLGALPSPPGPKPPANAKFATLFPVSAFRQWLSWDTDTSFHFLGVLPFHASGAAFPEPLRKGFALGFLQLKCFISQRWCKIRNLKTVNICAAPYNGHCWERGLQGRGGFPNSLPHAPFGLKSLHGH